MKHSFVHIAVIIGLLGSPSLAEPRRGTELAALALTVCGLLIASYGVSELWQGLAAQQTGDEATRVDLHSYAVTAYRDAAQHNGRAMPFLFGGSALLVGAGVALHRSYLRLRAGLQRSYVSFTHIPAGMTVFVNGIELAIKRGTAELVLYPNQVVKVHFAEGGEIVPMLKSGDDHFLVAWPPGDFLKVRVDLLIEQ